MPEKLCPMRKETKNRILHHVRGDVTTLTTIEGSTEEFLPCLGEQCQHFWKCDPWTYSLVIARAMALNELTADELTMALGNALKGE